MTEITAPGRILPSLQPPQWAGADAALCEPLIGDTTRWSERVELPYVAYGVDRGDHFDFFADDPARLIELRAAARSSLTALSFDLTLLSYDTLSVLDVHGSYYASESVLQPSFMRELESRLESDMLVVGIPCRGHAYVTAGAQSEDDLRRFLDLIETQHKTAHQPLFAIPVLVQAGDIVGLLHLTDDDDDDDDLETLTL
ncbi:MAG: hypothetical protein KUG77_01275 [Nannocystaceae bacterium]|nr:hypothetical protein [Nannocystaceae bacterium]